MIGVGAKLFDVRVLSTGAAHASTGSHVVVATMHVLWRHRHVVALRLFMTPKRHIAPTIRCYNTICSRRRVIITSCLPTSAPHHTVSQNRSKTVFVITSSNLPTLIIFDIKEAKTMKLCENRSLTTLSDLLFETRCVIRTTLCPKKHPRHFRL